MVCTILQLQAPFPTLFSSSAIIPSQTSLCPQFTKPLVVQKRRILRPLRVSAPPTPSTASPKEEEEDRVQENDLSVSSNEIEQETQDLGEDFSSKFSWRDHWYPVSLVEDLDPSLPTPFQLLNRDLVLWFDQSSSQWVAFDDKCPHRLAPLSVSSNSIV